MEHIKLYAVLNIEHPMVAWEVAIGRITTITAKDANGDEFPTPSLWMYNSILTGKNDRRFDDFLSEYQIEYFRGKKYPTVPSRFTGAFFFETYEDAVSACQYWEWDSYIEYISEIEFTCNQSKKYDSNWITNKIRACQPSERDFFINKYLSQEIEPAGPLWEVIAEGHGEILNLDLRRKAYNRILEDQPSSTPLLAIAMSCYDSDCNKYRELLRSIPYITKHSGKYHGQFIISMNQFDTEQEDIIKICLNYIRKWEYFHIPKLGEPLKITLPADGKSFIARPDLRKYEFEIDIEVIDNIITQVVNDSF